MRDAFGEWSRFRLRRTHRGCEVMWAPTVSILTPSKEWFSRENSGSTSLSFYFSLCMWKTGSDFSCRLLILSNGIWNCGHVCRYWAPLYGFFTFPHSLHGSQEWFLKSPSPSEEGSGMGAARDELVSLVCDGNILQWTFLLPCCQFRLFHRFTVIRWFTITSKGDYAMGGGGFPFVVVFIFIPQI